jgi:hypothetical protein
MCFSPQVDLVTGVTIAVVAVDAARHCRTARQAPLAALPAIFAVHTLVSAAVWWGLWGDLPASLGNTALQTYLFIAYALLPVYVPLAVLLIEPRGWRRWALTGLLAVGAVASAVFLAGLVGGRGVAEACSYYIDFDITGTPTFAGVLYVLATCGAFLLSGKRPLVIWGVTNVAAVGLLALLESQGLPSLWCFWAACTSVFVAWYLRSDEAANAARTPRLDVVRRT